MSIVDFFPDHRGTDCGYCKAKDSCFSLGMWAIKLTCRDYQDLLDRGWRRCGQYVYKPTMDATCCPSYTVRCRLLLFSPSKSQKKVQRRWIKYLTFDDASTAGGAPPASTIDYSTGITPKIVTPGCGADPNKPRCVKTKKLRRERKLAKQAAKGSGGVAAVAAAEGATTTRPTLPSFSHLSPLDLGSSAPKRSLRIVVVRSHPPSQEFQRTLDESFHLYAKYQRIIHGDSPDEITKSSFVNFLCDSPLVFEPKDFGRLDFEIPAADLFAPAAPATPATPATGLGSFHQQYWLEDRLVAVGVVDILPSCLSSVYLYYDPDFGFLSPGVFSALHEIHTARLLSARLPELRHYYMGYYIHSCPKMRYKASYRPSELLCPATYSWVPVEAATPKLDKSGYAKLSTEGEDKDEEVDAGSVTVFYDGSIMDFASYRDELRRRKDEEEDGDDDDDDWEEVKLYSRLVGGSLSRSLVLLRGHR